MKKIIQQKEMVINQYCEKIKTSSVVVVFKYLGLDAEDMTKLRKELLASNAKLHVLKNNITSRALAKSDISDFGSLKGANAIIIGTGDVILPLKSVKDLMKKNDFVQFEGSVVEGNFIDAAGTISLAGLPNREGMYSMVLSCLTAPIRGVLYALKAVIEASSEASQEATTN